MPECTGKDLKNSRVRANLTQWQVANECVVSESTVQRWESGETLPSPDDVDRYAMACGDAALWNRWMLSHYDSYRKRFIDSIHISGLSASLTRLRYEMADVMELHGSADRDAIDGRIDDPVLKARLVRQLQEMQAATADLLQKLVADTGGDA